MAGKIARKVVSVHCEHCVENLPAIEIYFWINNVEASFVIWNIVFVKVRKQIHSSVIITYLAIKLDKKVLVLLGVRRERFRMM